MAYVGAIVLERDGEREEYGFYCDTEEGIVDLAYSGLYRLKASLKGAKLLSYELRPSGESDKLAGKET